MIPSRQHLAVKKSVLLKRSHCFAFRFAHLARLALRAPSERLSGVVFFQRAFPPSLLALSCQLALQ
jgi:hypothetical protein